ncbi:S41 family peptidase [Paenibacillus sp. HB172176]|uniref:S41 family peptidase n=1 Tax=Paenibacillus sp. HB172176 TaxID=2493690 RepID=UPI001438B7C4|nr:S41 family peptidase [Paenibacillus sp. HB172176]
MDNSHYTISQKKSKLPYAIGVVLLLVAGYLLGLLAMHYRYPIMKEPEFKQLNASYNRIMNDYLDGATADTLINGAAQGMVASLEDPYSQYLIGEKGEAYTQSYKDQFFGIGAELRQEDERFVIQSVIKDTPAEKGGVLANDVIIAVDGKELKGKSLQDLLELVRGAEGTSLTLTLQRAGRTEPIVVKLKRAAIPVHTVTSELLSGGIAHITISRFAEKTGEEFKTELAKLKEEGELKGLLLDLRSNPGGLLSSTIEIASMLVPKDKKILDVVYKNERKTVTFKSDQKEDWKLPIVVLVNEHSASASEVMTAALKESAGATVVGKKTFGKGIVQSFSQFSDGSVLSLTEAQWKTPNGTWIHHVGVSPDYDVDLPSYANLLPLAVGSEIKLGSYGDDVKTLQTMLSVLGYSSYSTQEGVFDKQTESALKQFQSDQKLNATGLFDDKTGYRLVEMLREKLAKEDTQLKKGIELLSQQASAEAATEE